MSIHQTKDGRWFAAYRESGSRAVKRKYFGRGTEAKVLAKKFEAEWLDRHQRNEPLPIEAPSLTFAELAQKYLNLRPLSPNTRSCLVYSLNLHVLPLWGRVQVCTLTMAHLAELDEALIQKGLSLATRNRYRAYCKAICQWGVTNDLVTANPFQKFRPDTKKEGKAPDLVTESELRAIYQAAGPHLQWAIEVLTNTGVRPGPTELFALKMADVDDSGGGLWVTRRKTHSKRTLLPLRPDFLAKLHALKTAEPDRVYLIEYDGRPVGSLKTAWHAALKRAGITRRLRLYDLRHWFASILLSGGADLKATSELMGHSSPTLTLATYYHLMDRQKRLTMERLSVPDFATADKPSDKPQA